MIPVLTVWLALFAQQAITPTPAPPPTQPSTQSAPETPDTSPTPSKRIDWAHAPCAADASGAYRGPIGMKNPILIYKVDPEWTKDARKMKIQGLMLVNLIVDEKGKATNVHVLRSITGTVPEKLRAAALPLDQKAVDAVSHYRFKPGRCNGKIVPVEMNVEVNFDFQH